MCVQESVGSRFTPGDTCKQWTLHGPDSLKSRREHFLIWCLITTECTQEQLQLVLLHHFLTNCGLVHERERCLSAGQSVAFGALEGRLIALQR